MCNTGYYVSNGLTEARCLGYGVLWPSGYCKQDGCDGADALAQLKERYDEGRPAWADERGTNCDTLMQEGQTCTPNCKKGKNPEEDELTMGFWMCKRGMILGTPTCTDLEGRHWLVSWVLPKIMGGFRFRADLPRGWNITNETISTFQYNTSTAVMSIMSAFKLRELSIWRMEHVLTETRPDGSFKVKYRNFELPPEFLTLWNTYEFRFYYEVLIWDKNSLTQNEQALFNLGEAGTPEYIKFHKQMLDIASCHIEAGSLLPLMMPLTFNDTFIAPDTEITSKAWLRKLNAGLWALLYWIVSMSLRQFESPSSERTGRR